MTIHTYHPDSHTHGLSDDCPRCQEHTENPLGSLDRQNIQRLLAGTIFTRTDAIAAARLQDIRTKARWLEEIVAGEVTA